MEDVFQAWEDIVSSPHHLVTYDSLETKIGVHAVEVLVRNKIVRLHPVVSGWEEFDGYGKPDQALISAGSVPNLLAIKKFLVNTQSISFWPMPPRLELEPPRELGNDSGRQDSTKGQGAPIGEDEDPLPPRVSCWGWSCI